MISNFKNWILNNKLASFLIVVVAYFLFFGTSSRTISRLAPKQLDFSSMEAPMMESAGYGGAGPQLGYSNKSVNQPAPVMDVAERMVVTDSRMSLLVKDVKEAAEEIQTEAETRGGYMVQTNITEPEEGATGYITIRVPSDQLKSMLNYLRGKAVRVVSENISGTDITDQYVDTEARLATLAKTKATYERLLDQATEINDIERITEKILNVQSQIDRVKGQLKYMEATTSSTSIQVYLATDELALPFTPGTPWRPSVVFKYAVRSLIGTTSSLINAGIWLGVYAVLWVPALVLFIVARKMWKKRSTGNDK